MPLIIKDAVKHQLKARIGLLAPTGGGKTFTGLTFANEMVKLGMAKRIGVIDSEHRSASKYIGDPFPPFRVIELEDDFSPDTYVEAIQLMADDGVDALLIDSLTHAWAGKGGALETKDRIAKMRGYNDYTAWGPVGAMHIRLIETMLSYPGHLIATMRLKMEYVMEENPVTKRNEVRKVGLAPVQREGMEYEFDLVGDLDQLHNFTVSKTRCSPLDGYSATKPGKEVIVKMRAWLDGGTAEADRAKVSSPASAPASPVTTSRAAVPATGEEVKNGAASPRAAERNAALVGQDHPTAATAGDGIALYNPASPDFAAEIAKATTQKRLHEIAVEIKRAKVTGAPRDALLAVYEKREHELTQKAAAA